MNPPHSYIDPTNVARIDVLPSVTLVSVGGDNVGGTILVDSASPPFSTTQNSLYRGGTHSSFFRSNRWCRRFHGDKH
jgi:iron complex outermembrane receptor protein